MRTIETTRGPAEVDLRLAEPSRGLLVLGLVLLDGLEGDLPLRLLPVWGLHL